ncbi:MAG: protein kinase [Verrucomicrobiota bacterium]
MDLPPINDYQYDFHLGEGSTGDVYACSDENGSVAIKLFKGLAINRRRLQYSIHRLGAAPAHANVAPVFASNIEEKPAYMITPLYVRVEGDSHIVETLESHCGNCPPDESWKLLRQIADGLAHLHRYDVVHCSVNPANILFQNPNSRDVVITDYAQGLMGDVYHLEPSEALCYAPPEQLLHSQFMDFGAAQKWDVYAFGGVAYRLLYGHHARANDFIETLVDVSSTVEFNAEDLAAHLKAEEEVTWPPATGGFAEQRQQLLDRCLSIDPANRPVDMRDVAQALGRIESEEVLNHERSEIRLNEREQALRMQDTQKKFHKLFALAAGLAALLTLGSLLFIATGVRNHSRIKQTNEEASQARLAREAAEKQATEARASLTEARESSDEFLSILLSLKDPSSPEHRTLGEALDDARSHYRETLEPETSESRAPEELLRARLNLGAIQSTLNEPAEALEHFDDATRRLTEMIEKDPSQKTEWARALIAAGTEKAILYLKMGRNSQALQQFVKLGDLLQDSRESYRKPVRFHREEARNLFHKGLLLGRLDQTSEGLKKLEEAKTLFATLTSGTESINTDRYFLARTNKELGKLQNWDARKSEALASYLEAANELARLVEEKPGVTPYRLELAECHLALGILLQERGDKEESLVGVDSAYGLLQDLIVTDASNPDYQFNIARTLAQLAATRRDSGDREKAITSLQQAIVLVAHLSEIQPTHPDYAYHVILYEAFLSELYDEDNQPTKSLTEAKKVPLKVRELEARKAKPGIPQRLYRLQLAEIMGYLSQIHEMAGEAETSRELLTKAHSYWTRLAADFPNDGQVQQGLASCDDRLSRVQ